MSAPPRLIDDPSAPPSLRSDLRAAAETDPRPFDPATGIEALRARIGAAPAPPIAPPLGPWFWGLTGIGAAVVVGGIVAGASWLASDAERGADVEEAQTVEPTAAAPADVGASAMVELGDVAPALEERPITSPPSVPSPVASPSVVRASRAAPNEPRAAAPREELPVVAPPTPREQDPDALLRLEMEHLARLRSTFARDPAAALPMAEDGQRRFPTGMFREEREALAVLSLARLHRPEARTRAERFLRHHPRGPFSEEIQRVAAVR